MAQRFYKGRTRNHLSWAMVDSTDFATPESALSAATKIKIYGKLRADSGVYFVSSGAGSLAGGGDIKHVGASVLGIYTIALAKADLSDASAAWYDQYIVSLSATGAAYQMLVVEGVIDESTLSGLISDIQSAVLLCQSAASDAASAAQQANSRVLLVQSRLSDFDSRLVSDVSDIRSMLSDMMSDFQSRVPKRVATDSQLSDLHSDLRSYLAVMSGIQSDILSAVSDLQSDFQSRVPKRVATDSQLSDLSSDLKSAIAGITASVSASDISDIASAVWANTIGARVDSRVLVAQSFLSDIRSHVSDLQSDFQSRVPKRVATDSQLSDLHSDLKSAIAAGVPLDASTMSDLRSVVLSLSAMLSDAHSAAAQGNSRVLIIQSQGSDLLSMVSDLQSDFQSRVPKRVATDSQLSDLSSDLKSAIAGIAVAVTASDISDIASAVRAILVSDLSDILSAAQQTNSRALVAQSYLSDIRSHVSDLQSDFQSRVPKEVAARSQLSDLASDLKSAVGNITVTIGASDVSDIASAVVAALPIASQVSDIYSMLSDLFSDFQSRVPKRVATESQLSDVESNLRSLITTGVTLDASTISDIRSAVLSLSAAISDAHSAATQANSRVLVAGSTVSDIYSLLSDLQSDFQSRVPKRVATDSQLSDVASDLRSLVLVVQSMASDAHSAAAAGASRALLVQSHTSDIYSLLSDLHSDVGVLSGVMSDVHSEITGGVEIGASSLSDLRSVVAAHGVLRAGQDPTGVPGVTAPLADKLDWLTALARNKVTQTPGVQSLRNDADDADVASAATSDDGLSFVREQWQ